MPNPACSPVSAWVEGVGLICPHLYSLPSHCTLVLCTLWTQSLFPNVCLGRRSWTKFPGAPRPHPSQSATLDKDMRDTVGILYLSGHGRYSTVQVCIHYCTVRVYCTYQKDMAERVLSRHYTVQIYRAGNSLNRSSLILYLVCLNRLLTNSSLHALIYFEIELKLSNFNEVISIL